MRKHIIFVLFLFAVLTPSSIFVLNEQSTELSSTAQSFNQCIAFYNKEPKSVDDRFFVFPKTKKPSYVVNADFFAGLGKKGFNWIRHRDDKGKPWIVSFSSLSPGVSEFLLRSPTELPFQEQLLTLMDYFQTFGFSQIRDSKMGIAMQIESGSFPTKKHSRRNFHFYRISELERLRKNGKLQKAQLSAFEDYLDFALDGYSSRRMKISPENREKLKNISMKVRGRSHLLFLSEDSMIEHRDEFNITHIKYDAEVYRRIGIDPATIPTRILPEKFNFTGGAVVVTSRSAKEPLPLELFTGFQVPRTAGVTAEIGRFFVSRVHRDPKTSYNLIGLIGSLLKANQDKQIGNVDQIVIEADAARADIFSDYGFKSIHEQINFEGKKEFVMTATPQAVVENARRILLEGLASESSRTSTTLFRPKRMELTIARSYQLDPKAIFGDIHSFGDSWYGALASHLYDLNLSTADWNTKVKSLGTMIEQHNLEISKAFSEDPDGTTRRLINALASEGMNGYFRTIKELETPYMSAAEIQHRYPTETIYPALNEMDKVISLYPTKHERLLALRTLFNSDLNFWRYLHGDHGIHYAILDYYLNGSPTHPPSLSFQRAVNRNRGSDLNLFDINFPEMNKELVNLVTNTYRTPPKQRNYEAVKREVFRVISADPKFNETHFRLIWREFEKALVQTEYDKDDFHVYAQYIFWHNLVYISKHIEDITFIRRNVQEREELEYE